jgi:hypothetical protein
MFVPAIECIFHWFRLFYLSVRMPMNRLQLTEFLSVGW